jgi:hypothetical protein
MALANRVCEVYICALSRNKVQAVHQVLLKDLREKSCSASFCLLSLTVTGVGSDAEGACCLTFGQGIRTIVVDRLPGSHPVA